MKSIFLGTLVLFFMSSWVMSYDIADYPYKSKYDSTFANMSDQQVLLNALDDTDIDMVYSALRRVGQLGITNARAKVEVLVSSANPAANQGKVRQNAAYRHIFYVGVMTLGKIGDASDGAMLSAYLHDTKDTLGILCIVQAMGDLTVSKTALESLNEYCLSLHAGTDVRIVKQLVDSILSHNSRSSITPLLMMQGKMDKGTREYINEAVKKLSASGK